jgi:hypothetical protein
LGIGANEGKNTSETEGDMSDMQRRVALHRDARVLIDYLRDHQPAPVESMVQDGVLGSRAAADALQYALQYGAICREDIVGGGFCELVRYSLTGSPLRPNGARIDRSSFDALLGAWGIARVPPQLPSDISVQVILAG